MKIQHITASILTLASQIFAGEASLTTTYQPLDALRGGGEIVIAEVTCYHWHYNSAASGIDLIAAPNTPPSDEPKLATANLNLASTCGLKFSASDRSDPKAERKIEIDATNFVLPKNSSFRKENIIRACLECIRRCVPELLKNTPITVKATEKDIAWMSAIIREYNSHDRSKSFFKSEW